MARRYRGGRGTALRPRRRAGARTGFSPRRGTGTPRPARAPETDRVCGDSGLRFDADARLSLARSGFSLRLPPPPRLSCPVVGAHARLPTWAVMDSGATVGGTRERAASRGKGHVEGKFSRARPRGVVPSLISRSGLFSSRWIYRTWYYFAVRFGRRKERILGGISLLQIIVQWGEGDDSGMGQFR